VEYIDRLVERVPHPYASFGGGQIHQSAKQSGDRDLESENRKADLDTLRAFFGERFKKSALIPKDVKS